MQIGRVEAHVLSDGTLKMDGGMCFGIIPKVLWEKVAPPDELNRILLGLNSLFLRSDGKNILVETGLGAKMSPRQEEVFGLNRDTNLLKGLMAIGVQPADVDIVINTHLHLDHCGWNTVEQAGKLVPTFPNAEYWIQRSEWEAATHPNERTRGVYRADDFAPLKDYGMVHLVDGDARVTSEVRCVFTPGHTEAHQAIGVESGGQTALVTGDLVHHPVHLERLNWASAFDVLPLVALETKRKIVEYALKNGTLIILTHDAFPALGYLRSEDGRTRYERAGELEPGPPPGR